MPKGGDDRSMPPWLKDRKFGGADVDPNARRVFVSNVFDAAAADAARITAKATSSEYLDTHHFTPGVYHDLNRELLRFLNNLTACQRAL